VSGCFAVLEHLAELDGLGVGAHDVEEAHTLFEVGQAVDLRLQRGIACVFDRVPGGLNVVHIQGDVVDGTGLAGGGRLADGLEGLDADVLELKEGHVVGGQSGLKGLLKAEALVELNRFFQVVGGQTDVLDTGHALGNGVHKQRSFFVW